MDVRGAVGDSRLEHRAQDAVLAGQGPERGDQLVAHARRQEAAKAPLAVGEPERRESGRRQLSRTVHESLEHVLDGLLGRHGEHGVADRLQGGAELGARRHRT